MRRRRGTGKPTPSVEKIQRSTRGSAAKGAALASGRDVRGHDAAYAATAAWMAGCSSGVSQPM